MENEKGKLKCYGEGERETGTETITTIRILLAHIVKVQLHMLLAQSKYEKTL